MRYGVALLEEGAISVFARSVSRNKILNQYFFGWDVPQSPLEQFPQLFRIVRSPSLILCGVYEVLLDRRLQSDRKVALDLIEFVNGPRVPSARRRDAELFCQAVSVTFIPERFNRIPIGCWHTK